MAQHSEAYDAIMARLAGGGRVVLDGGVGTEAQRRGVPLRAWAALAGVEHPEVLLALHADYIEAGSDVISANTFGCSDARLREFGMPGREEELNHAAVALALRARAQADAGRPVLVAGSMTTVGHRGPDGNTMSAPEDEQSLASQAGALATAGVDLIIVEMLANVAHANVELAAAASAGVPLWAGFSCKLNDAGEVTLLGEPSERFEDSLRRIDLSRVDVAMVMHTSAADVGPALDALRSVWPGPVGAYPHGGRWARPEWEFAPDFTPEALASSAASWVAKGCQLVGGCCGTGPEHIAALREVVDATVRA